METIIIHTPKRIAESETVFIGEGSKWENPFKVGEYYEHIYGLIESDEDAQNALRNALVIPPFDYAAFNAGIIPMHFYDPANIAKHLKGKTLLCGCCSEFCHGKVLIELIND